MQAHATTRRRNRVYKSLHKPLTYLGVERTLFFFVCVAAVGAFNLFNSLLAGIAVFFGGYASAIGSRTPTRHFCAFSRVPSGTRPAMTQRNRRSRAWRCSDAAPRQSHQAVEGFRLVL